MIRAYLIIIWFMNVFVQWSINNRSCCVNSLSSENLEYSGAICWGVLNYKDASLYPSATELATLNDSEEARWHYMIKKKLFQPVIDLRMEDDIRHYGALSLFRSGEHVWFTSYWIFTCPQSDGFSGNMSELFVQLLADVECTALERLLPVPNDVSASTANKDTVEVTLWMQSTTPHLQWIPHCVSLQTLVTKLLNDVFEPLFTSTELRGSFRNASCLYDGIQGEFHAALIKLEFDATGYSQFIPPTGRFPELRFENAVRAQFLKRNYQLRVMHIQYPTPSGFSRMILDGALVMNGNVIEWGPLLLEEDSTTDGKRLSDIQLKIKQTITKIDYLKFPHVELAYLYPHKNEVHARLLLEAENYRIPTRADMELFGYILSYFLQTETLGYSLYSLNITVQTHNGTWSPLESKSLPSEMTLKNQHRLKISIEGYLLHHGHRVTWPALTEWLNTTSSHNPWYYVDKQVDEMRRDLGLLPFHQLIQLDHYLKKNGQAALVVYFFADSSSQLLASGGWNATQHEISDYFSNRTVTNGLDHVDLYVQVPNISEDPVSRAMRHYGSRQGRNGPANNT